MVNMVTRLGECVIVYFGQFYENDKSGPHFWATFLPRLRLCINFDKNLLGYILGDFFPANSSGHPDGKPVEALFLQSFWKPRPQA
jgi:hypothetical protein